MEKCGIVCLIAAACAFSSNTVVLGNKQDAPSRPSRRIRGVSVQRDPSRHLQAPKQKLSVKKQHEEDRNNDSSERNKYFLERAVLHCDSIVDLDNCWEEISDMGQDIRLIHRLHKIRALAIETDKSTLEDLESAGFSITQDTVRETLAVNESLQYLPRHLLGGGQQVPYGVDLIRARDVWEQYGVRGEDIRVCIMDTGLDAKHADFEQTDLQGWDTEGEFVVPWDEDLVGHGTHITGILAASDNDKGFVGVAPGVQIFFIRVFTDQGQFYGSDVVAAAEACRDNGADIISMSLGGRGFDQGEHDIFRDLLQNDGIIAVSSSGNTGGPELIYPAGYNSVVSVTACDEDKRIPSFASFNSFVNIAAPGKDIPSTYIHTTTNGNKSEAYASLSGTSMAVPYVVGALALMKSFSPSASPEELLYALTHSTQSVASSLNVGLVDALAAVQMLETGVDLALVTPTPCLEASLGLDTDSYGEETAYRLRRVSDNSILWKGVELESYTEYLEDSCLDPNDCYEFIIRDRYGDGILRPGGIFLIFGEQSILTDGNFGRGGKTMFGEQC